MKKLFNIGWIILAIGLVMLAVGYFNGGNKTINFNHGHPEIITNRTQKLSTNKQFNRLNLDVSTADVVIKQGKKYQVTYYGKSNVPTAKLNGKTMTVKQKSVNFQVNFSVNHDDYQDLIVITVPKDKKLTGQLNLNDGDLRISKVTLDKTAVDTGAGDVSYDQVKVIGGQTTLSEGDFTAQQLQVDGHYTVHNDEGDNTVTDTSVDGYYLHTDDGDNNLNGEDKGDQTLTTNDGAVNVLRLITTEGDNQVN